MSDSKNVEIEYWAGCVAAIVNSRPDQEHRWWFQETDGNRLVFVSEVVHFKDLDKEKSDVDGRHFKDESEAEVPDHVGSAVDAESYDGRVTEIVDTDGQVLHS